MQHQVKADQARTEKRRQSHPITWTLSFLLALVIPLGSATFASLPKALTPSRRPHRQPRLRLPMSPFRLRKFPIGGP
jgi:hypothetical protein